MTALLTGLASLLVFSSVILVHELGHFMAARHCGIHVEEFSIGFGPCLWSTTRDGTTYSVRLLPLGGYNLFSPLPDEEDNEEDMLQGVEDEEILNAVFNLFMEKNADEFQFEQ